MNRKLLSTLIASALIAGVSGCTDEDGYGIGGGGNSGGVTPPSEMTPDVTVTSFAELQAQLASPSDSNGDGEVVIAVTGDIDLTGNEAPLVIRHSSPLTIVGQVEPTVAVASDSESDVNAAVLSGGKACLYVASDDVTITNLEFKGVMPNCDIEKAGGALIAIGHNNASGAEASGAEEPINTTVSNLTIDGSGLASSADEHNWIYVRPNADEDEVGATIANSTFVNMPADTNGSYIAIETVKLGNRNIYIDGNYFEQPDGVAIPTAIKSTANKLRPNSIYIRNNAFNNVEAKSGSIIEFYGVNSEIVNNTFENSVGNIDLGYSGSIKVTGNAMFNDPETDGVGIVMANRNNTIANNYIDGAGAITIEQNDSPNGDELNKWPTETAIGGSVVSSNTIVNTAHGIEFSEGDAPCSVDQKTNVSIINNLIASETAGDVSAAIKDSCAFVTTELSTNVTNAAKQSENDGYSGISGTTDGGLIKTEEGIWVHVGVGTPEVPDNSGAGNPSYTPSEPPTSNNAPVADISVSSASVELGGTVTFDGTRSSDADFNTLTYLWTISGAPGDNTAFLDTPDQATTTFTPSAPGNYEITLVVNDGIEDSAAATVPLSVTIPNNSSPVITLTDDLSANFGQEVTLDGTATDADGDTLTYDWEITDPEGINAPLAGADDNSRTFKADKIGQYVVKLSVSDSKVTVAETVTVTVSHLPGIVTKESLEADLGKPVDLEILAGDTDLQTAINTATAGEGDKVTILLNTVDAPLTDLGLLYIDSKREVEIVGVGEIPVGDNYNPAVIEGGDGCIYPLSHNITLRNIKFTGVNPICTDGEAYSALIVVGKAKGNAQLDGISGTQVDPKNVLLSKLTIDGAGLTTTASEINWVVVRSEGTLDQEGQGTVIEMSEFNGLPYKAGSAILLPIAKALHQNQLVIKDNLFKGIGSGADGSADMSIVKVAMTKDNKRTEYDVALKVKSNRFDAVDVDSMMIVRGVSNVVESNTFVDSQGVILLEGAANNVVKDNTIVSDTAAGNDVIIRLATKGHTIENNYFKNVLASVDGNLAGADGVIALVHDDGSTEQYVQKAMTTLNNNTLVNSGRAISFSSGMAVDCSSEVINGDSVTVSAPSEVTLSSNVVVNQVDGHVGVNDTAIADHCQFATMTDITTTQVKDVTNETLSGTHTLTGFTGDITEPTLLSESDVGPRKVVVSE